MTDATRSEPGGLVGDLAERLCRAVLQRRALTGVRVIDAHAHLGPYSRFFIPEPEPSSMVRVMDRCGVAVSCVASHLAIELDARRGNESTASAVDTSAGRLWGLLTLNPHQDPEREAARWIDDQRFVGVKLHPDLHEYPITGSRYTPAWELARAWRLPVLVHTWAGSRYDDPAMLSQVAERNPDIAIVVGHAGATPAGFEVAAELARRHPEIYLEICGSFMTGTWLNRLVDVAGARRVLYGSDFPFIDMRYSIGRVLFAGLEEAQLRLVLGDAFADLVRRSPAHLPGPDGPR